MLKKHAIHTEANATIAVVLLFGRHSVCKMCANTFSSQWRQFMSDNVFFLTFLFLMLGHQFSSVVHPNRRKKTRQNRRSNDRERRKYSFFWNHRQLFLWLLNKFPCGQKRWNCGLNQLNGRGLVWFDLLSKYQKKINFWTPLPLAASLPPTKTITT